MQRDTLGLTLAESHSHHKQEKRADIRWAEVSFRGSGWGRGRVKWSRIKFLWRAGLGAGMALMKESIMFGIISQSKWNKVTISGGNFWNNLREP